MSKPRVAIFSLAYQPFVGGAEIAIDQITRRLPDQEFSVFTLRFDRSWPREELVNGARIIRVGRGATAQSDYYGRFFQKVFYVFRAWLAAEKAHRQTPFAAIWAMMASYAGMAALLFKLRHPGVPMLLTLQEGDSEEHILKRVSIFYPFWRLIFRKADRVQVISNYLADFAKRHGARCPIDVVPNGVDVAGFHSLAPEKKKGVFTIVTTSRLVYKNGVDTLIDSLGYLNQPVILQIIGDGPNRLTLELRSKKFSDKAEIIFTGAVAPEEIPQYLARADIFVRPARSEGLGNSFLEAMAAGLPIIGTNVGGIPDFLKDGETGIFAKVDDPKDLAEKIEMLLKNKKLREKIAAAGRDLARKNYDWSIIAEKMSDIFRLLSGTRVLLATGIYPPDLGGPAKHVQRLRDLLPGHGYQPRVLTYGASPISEAVVVDRSLPPGLRHLVYLWKCFWLGLRSDVIYAQDATATGLPAMLVAKLLKKQFVIRIGGDILWERVAEQGRQLMPVREYYRQGLHLKDRPVFYSLIKLVLRSADYLIVPAQILKDLYTEFYFVGPEKIKVISNPFTPAVVQRKNQAGDPDRIIFAGRFLAYKNLELLIRVFDRVRKNLGRGSLMLVGAGPETKKLEQLAASLPAAPFISIRSALPREELFQEIQASAICVGPALTEFNPNFILECLSFKKPVLLSRENGLSVNLSEDLLFDPRDEPELEKKMTQLLEPAGYKKAQKFVTELPAKPTWEEVAQSTAEIFKSLNI